MAKSKTHKDDEELKGKMRDLEKQNKALRKRLRQLEKNKHIWEENNLDETDPSFVIKPIETAVCPQCSKSLLSFDLGIKILWSCTNCSYRKTQSK